MTNALEREAPAAFLETENSKADEHLSAAEVGSGKEPAFSEYPGRVRDMVFLGCILWLLIELCFFTYVLPPLFLLLF